MDIVQLLCLAALVACGWFLWDSLRAREIANSAMRNACRAHGWLFLDDTVALRSVRPARDEHGRVRLRRVFEFAYSGGGFDRQAGMLALLGSTVAALELGVGATTTPRPAVAEVVLRRPKASALAADAAAAADLLVASRRATLPGLAEPRSESEIHAWMRAVVFPTRSMLIAEAGGEIVGFAQREGEWLEQLYVKPGWQGRGIGQRLLDAMLDEARTHVTALRLHAFQRNERARRFYERNGFVAVAFGDGRDNEEREPDVRYECELTQPQASKNGRSQSAR